MSAKISYHPGRKWLSVTVLAPVMLVEPVAGILIQLSGNGVEIDDAAGPDQKAMVIAYFSLETDMDSPEMTDEQIEDQVDEIRTELDQLRLFSENDPYKISYKIIDEEDWSSTWKEFFKAFEIIPGLIIKPSWEEYKPKKGRHIIEMDPGMAFGTGQHATTQMALALLHSIFPEGTPEAVLDVGTGTGILGIAAAVFGASRVICIDNDPEAVLAAITNVKRNHLDHRVQVGHTPLEELKGTFDVICANIVHDVLVEMGPEFSRLLCGKGWLVLSGILKGDQEKNINKVYRRLGFKLLATKYDKEWAALLFGRRGVATSILVKDSVEE